MDNQDSIPGRDSEGIFSLRQRVQTGLKDLSSLLYNGYWGLFTRM